MGLLAGLAGLVSQVGLPNMKKIKNVKVSKMAATATIFDTLTFLICFIYLSLNIAKNLDT